jgi:hypothetical protein
MQLQSAVHPEAYFLQWKGDVLSRVGSRNSELAKQMKRATWIYFLEKESEIKNAGLYFHLHWKIKEP